MTFSTIASLGVSLQGGGGSGGGGGTPGGSDTQVQFNDGGSFGGDAGLTFNKTTDVLTLGGSQVINGGTLNGTLLNMSQTWGGTGTYTGIKYDVTDSGPSNAASLLMDLQVGGTSLFSVRKDGTVLLSTTAGFRIQSGSTLNFYTSTLTSPSQVFTVSSIRLRSDTGIYTIGGSDDVVLGRRGAANLRFGAADAAAPVAQTLSVQSVVAGTTNTAGANLTITGSQGTGNATGGSIIFQVAPAGSTGSVQNALETVMTVNSNRRVQLNGEILTTSRIALDGGTGGNGRLQIGENGSVAWGAGGAVSLGSNIDLVLLRDAANTLALRNGTNAQAFRVYNTFTDATTFERANFFWDSNVLKIGTEKGSVGGTARALEFQTDGTTRLTIETTGSVGIGAAPASNTRLNIQAATFPGGRETILRSSVTDDTTGSFFIYNGTSFDARFIPSFAGYFDKLDSRESLGFLGLVSAANDVSNSSAMGVINFGASRTTSSSDPINGTFSDIANRNIFSIAYKFAVSTESDCAFIVKAGGGVTMPVGALSIGSTTVTASTLTLADAVNVSVGTTTGTKIGTATTQKLGFWNAAPVVQPTAVADATDAPSVITQLNALLAHMRTIGLIAT